MFHSRNLLHKVGRGEGEGRGGGGEKGIFKEGGGGGGGGGGGVKGNL